MICNPLGVAFHLFSLFERVCIKIATETRPYESQYEMSYYFNLITLILKFNCNLFFSSVYSFSQPVYSPDSSLALSNLGMFCAFKKFTNEI